MISLTLTLIRFSPSSPLSLSRLLVSFAHWTHCAFIAYWIRFIRNRRTPFALLHVSDRMRFFCLLIRNHQVISKKKNDNNEKERVHLNDVPSTIMIIMFNELISPVFINSAFPFFSRDTFLFSPLFSRGIIACGTVFLLRLLRRSSVPL